MMKQQVWWKTFKYLVPPNHQCVKCKWIFKIKCNRVYSARQVACEYSQIPGATFLENYVPSMNGIIYWVFLLIMIHLGFSVKVIDKIIFLYCMYLSSRPFRLLLLTLQVRSMSSLLIALATVFVLHAMCTVYFLPVRVSTSLPNCYQDIVHFVIGSCGQC